jgi:hypothetical protein
MRKTATHMFSIAAQPFDSPFSTRRLIASERDMPWSSAHSSSPAIRCGGMRTPTSGSFPVAGRPLFLGLTPIDFAMRIGLT